MELFVLDEHFNTLAIFDTFESLIWADRYNDIGDFELYTPAGAKDVETLQPKNYLYRKDSKKLMAIDTIQIKTDVEDGDHISVTGKSLEDILNHYVIFPEKILNGNFQEKMFELLRETIVEPDDSGRKIPDFHLIESSDPIITALTIEAYYEGDNLFDVIQSQCADKNIGFRILPDWNGGYNFEFYAGVNRSYSQSDVPWVVFSPQFDNFISSDYVESNVDMATICMLTGEAQIVTIDETGNETTGDSVKMITTVASDEKATGIDRREIFLDAGTIRAYNWAEAFELLKQKGKEELQKHKYTKDFEGTIESSRQYIYGRDFFVGDIVQVANSYKKEAESRVSEVIYSLDTTGERIIPTFTFIKKEDEQ